MLPRMWKQRIRAAFTDLTGYRLEKVAPQAPAPSGAKGSAGRPDAADGSTGSARTVAEGWEHYARKRRAEQGVGDVWSDPKKIGLDVASPAEVVPYLDREVFTPFFGTCDVMLEIGPGGGRFTEVLLPKCRRLIAVDTSETMLDLLRRRFGEQASIDFHLSDGRGLTGVADGSVDAAFSYGVFVHLQHWDIYHYLAELQRVLKPGGKALIQHSNTFSDLGWAAFLREVPRQLNRHKLHASFIVNSPQLMRQFVEAAKLECVDTLTEVARRDCITLIRKPE